MENKPKRSRAFIITIILVLSLLLVGYLLFKNAKNSSSTNFISRIFSSLSPSSNTKKETVQAGEDIKKGNYVTKAGTASDGSAVVIKSINGSEIYGIANEDIFNGNFGEISVQTESVNNFMNSFADFVNGLFNNNNTNTTITSDNGEIEGDAGGEIIPGGGDITPPGGGDITPPGGGDITPPGGGDITPNSYECSDTVDNDNDGLIDKNDPECHLDGNLDKEYLPNHDSESEFTTNTGGETTPPDLTAGLISPTNTTVNTLTTISATISNNGGSSTSASFNNLFTITNITRNDEQTETGNTNLSKSKIKTFISKLVAKIPWASLKKTIAEDSVELSVVSSPINGNSSDIVSVFYSFDQSGTYYIRACADKSSASDEGTITESNEDNNCGPWTTFTVTDSLPIVGSSYQCSDTIDNDGDGLIDADDPECHTDGSLNEEYLPEYNSEASAGNNTFYECNDTIDNDGDGKIDENDPECHINGSLDNDYVPENDSESVAPIGSEENKCLLIEQNPLTFTDAEKAELANLLRKFYLIAPTLKTQDDIDMIYSEMDNYKNFITRLDDLTAQCYAESVNKNGIIGGHIEGGQWLQYTGPTIRYGNPWYKSDTRGSYINSSVNIEKSYCTGSGDDGHGNHYTCPSFKTKWTCENHIASNGKAYITGCKWISVTNIEEYEKILNVW